MMSDAISIPSGNAEAAGEEFARIFSQHGPHLLKKLSCLLGNHADAQDASQDAFLKYWRARTSAVPLRDVRAWLFRVGINGARDTQRSAWRRRLRSLDSAVLNAASGDSPARILEEKEDLDRLNRAMMQLPADEQAVFLLRQNDRLPYHEIAGLRNSPVGTVKTQMRRALAKLRQALRDANGAAK
jgi:RNA polymerase sigma-70 factor (ECF subfamily)